MFIRNKNALWNGKMVNGLLVKEVGDVFERVAVFQIDVDVWDEEIARSNSVPKMVYLG